MPVPPPLPDPTHIETRLLIVAAMLDKAVAEVHRVMDEVRGAVPAEAIEYLETPGVDHAS